jgi:hypothetical protein
MAQTPHDTLTIKTDIPEVWASQLRQHVGLLLDSALPGMQPSYAVWITSDNRLLVQVSGLNVATRSFFSSCLSPDPDNMTTDDEDEISPHEASNRIIRTFKEAGLNPQQAH